MKKSFDFDVRALEEWKILESINNRHIDLAFKTRGWMFTLITALTVGLFSDNVKISWWQFLILSYGLIFLFLGMELVQRTYTAKTRRRISEVESSLRGETEYDGPKITLKIDLDSTIKDLLIECRSQFIWIPYLLLFIAISLLSLFSNK